MNKLVFLIFYPDEIGCWHKDIKKDQMEEVVAGF